MERQLGCGRTSWLSRPWTSVDKCGRGEAVSRLWAVRRTALTRWAVAQICPDKMGCYPDLP
eukprot:356335-Chlamydomonas_euryale.AAC.1